MNLQDWRIDYDKYSLNELDLPECPIIFFQKWFDQAVLDQNPEPNAMTLTTCLAGKASSRIVLLKEIEAKEFQFYTNYTSQKAKEINENPEVFLLFYWPNSQRQVRVRGKAKKISREKSIEYFNSRPAQSRISAIASPQSEKVTKQDLVQKVEEIQNSGQLICPENWGGFTINPYELEFWQGQPSRLHDRIIYKKTEANQWETYRLAP